MANSYFQFKQFLVKQDRSAMKVTTDACLFGAWCARQISQYIHTPEQLLDIGTGTGLLSLMIAQQSPVSIEAVEIEPEAAIQARENISLSAWKERIKLFEADILEFNGGPYDVIVANPPFYENELTSDQNKKNIAHHSHLLTLKELIPLIRSMLKNEGVFYLLLPFKRMWEAEQLFEKSQLSLYKKVLVKQSFSHDFFRVFFSGGIIQKQEEETELSIWDESKQYTPEFISLLKDYYLYLG